MQTSETIHPDQIDSSVASITYKDIGSVVRYELSRTHIIVYGETVNYTILFTGPSVVRIVGSIHGHSADIVPTPALLPYELQLGWSIVEYESWLEISRGDVVVTITKATMSFRVSFGGKEVCDSHELYYAGKKLRCRGAISSKAMLYGLGETTGFMDKRGEKYTMWNSDVFDPHVPDMESLYQSIPLLIHHHPERTYGIFVDSPGRTVFDMRTDSEAYLIETENGAIDLYFIGGPGLKDVVSAYSTLTGTMKLPPLWSLGYQQSRFSYMSQDEVLDLARTFRSREIPCDVIYLDIHYMDEYKVFTFDKVRFPDPPKMMKELREMGFRIVPVVDPGVKIEEGYDVYEEGRLQKYFCAKPDGNQFVGHVWPGESVFPDFTSDKVSRWWGKLHQFYVDHGISGIWNDMNEPSVFNSSSKTMDADVIHENGGYPKSHGELHNLYGLLMCKATYEGLGELLQGKRPFILSRAGYAGIQRYAAVWTGDNRSYWEHMSLFMSMGINLGLSGVPFCGADIGGFAHHTSGELLTRWMQLGVFTPFCRNHSAIDTKGQEPWGFGDKVEAICRKYIELRYSLLPYIYSLFYEASQTGLPVMAPLVLEYPTDRNTFYLSDQFLFGKDMLVAPIYRPGTEHRALYLPEGIWYDYWSGERHQGGQHIVAQAPLDTMPIYIRSGAIIPQTEINQHTGTAEWAQLDFNVYCSGDLDGEEVVSQGQFTLYEDDGLTDNYNKGEYNVLKVYFQEQRDRISLGCKYEESGYGMGSKSLMFKLHHLGFIPDHIQGIARVDSMADLEVLLSGWYYSNHNHMLVIKSEFTDYQGMNFEILSC